MKKSLYLQKTTKTEAIENGKPVIATVNGSEEGVNHEVVVVGFPDEGDEETKGDDDGYNEFIDVVPSESGGMYICIDPSDGDYKTVSSFSLLGDSYKINYLKRY